MAGLAHHAFLGGCILGELFTRKRSLESLVHHRLFAVFILDEVVKGFCFRLGHRRHEVLLLGLLLFITDIAGGRVSVSVLGGRALGHELLCFTELFQSANGSGLEHFLPE